MAGDKYLINSGGQLTENRAIQTTAGGADAGKIIAANSSGVLDTTFLPPGTGPDTQVIQASEALSAGDLVNVHDGGSGVFRVRKADASTTGKQADGFVLAAVSSGANATVYLESTNNQVTGLTPGERWLSDTTPGGTTATAPTGAGKISQKVGIATSATTLNFEKGPVIQMVA